MQILVNDQISEARTLLYESNNGLIEVTRDHVLTIDKAGHRVFETNLDIVELEEKGKTVTLKIKGKKYAQLNDAKRWEYDFSKGS